MSIGIGSAERFLTREEVGDVVSEGLGSLSIDGKRVLVLIPDGTRTMPMPLMYDLLDAHLSPRAATVDYLVALGTHQPMSDEILARHIGRTVASGRCGKSRILNHQWSDPKTFLHLGEISRQEVQQITAGLIHQRVPVEINGLVNEYDQIVICGPVFPHEIVGFSGGNKYLFPGISGPEIIHMSHWFGALVTNYKVIGTKHTPIRAIIDRAAGMIDTPVACLSLVVTHEGISGIYFGSAQSAWDAAADLAAQKHVIYVDKPFQRVLCIMPTIYDDAWTAGKGMVKLEPAVADGGEVVLYAPHVTEFSYTHGEVIEKVGYHCRDYILAHWEQFKHYPHGILAHTTFMKGLGTYDTKTGIETPRIKVTLATGISEARCRKLNLDYLDPSRTRREEWEGREQEGIKVVPRAGEMLYRLRKAGIAAA
jgi:nickel-dependent lactate racemase